MLATDRLKIVAVAGLLLVSAGAGIAALTDDAPADERPDLETSSSQARDGSSGSSSGDQAPTAAQANSVGPSDYEDDVVFKEWTDSFDGAPASGSLDLRIDHGPVKVVGWDKPGYHVMVLQEPGDGQQAHDYETKAEFQDDSSGDSLDLTLTVERQGSYGVGVQSDAGSTEDPYRHRAIVAFVPAGTSFDEVNACSGHDHQFEDAWENAWRSVPWPWHDDETRVDVSCMEASGTGLAMHADLRYDDNESEEHEDHPFGIQAATVSGLDAETLTLANEHGDLAVKNTEAGQLTVLADHGDVEARGLSASNATLLSGHGDIQVRDADGADLAAASGSGDVAVDFTPTDDGTLALRTDHGEAVAGVAPASQVGYDVMTGTDHGDLTVALENTSVEKEDRYDNSSWQDPSHWTGWFQDDGYEKTAAGQSASWDDAAVQTEIRAFTDSGDVLVADGTQGPIDWDVEDDEDEDDDEADV